MSFTPTEFPTDDGVVERICIETRRYSLKRKRV